METDKEKIKMAQTFNANKLQTLIKIIIPANIPTFFNSLKVKFISLYKYSISSLYGSSNLYLIGPLFLYFRYFKGLFS